MDDIVKASGADTEDVDALIDSLPLRRETAKIANQILEETDVDKVKALTELFNLNQRKKNVIRIIQLNELLDAVSDQIAQRIEQSPGSFDNDDLLSYMTVVQSSIDRAQKSVDMISDTPAIQVNTQNNVNITVNDDGLSRESREKVSFAIQQILAKMNALNSSNNGG